MGPQLPRFTRNTSDSTSTLMVSLFEGCYLPCEQKLIWLEGLLWWEVMSVSSSGGSKGGARDARPPFDPRFLHFRAVFGKNWQNNRLAHPPLGLAPPPLGNPGSATE